MSPDTITRYAALFILFGIAAVLSGQIPAFPGAEGGGKYTIGGRGGTVYEVTNLNDSGPGSLREAVEAYGARTVVFRVSGTIILESDLKIKNAYITIAGQTAPGDGICIRGYQVVVDAIEVIIRFIRFRLGDETGVDDDCIWGRYRRNIIIDHCSASWSIDETMSFYANENFTLQWCILSESLYHSNHPKGSHGYGGIWGGKNATFHHNLLAHHSSRNPRFAGDETPRCEHVDFRNNVIYNWGFNSAYGGESGKVNMVANYYKSGPATQNDKKGRIVQPSNSAGRWYIEENYVAGYPGITADNWAGGVQGGYANPAVIRVTTPFPFEPITTETPEEAYLSVLENAGAIYPARDSLDRRIVRETRTGTVTFDGKYYELERGFSSDTATVRGIIDSQNNTEGWPELVSVSAWPDSDHDGMPDVWERVMGLDPDDPSDGNLEDPDGYTMLENYLNTLVDPAATPVLRDAGVPADFTLDQNYPNPFNPGTSIRFTLPRAGMVELVVYDIRGRKVRTLLQEPRAAGIQQAEWDGRDQTGSEVSSGIYFAQLHFREGTRTIKMQLVR